MDKPIPEGVVIARELARIDGFDPDDQHGGLYDLQWQGGSSPEPLGDAWNMDYLPRGERIASALTAAQQQGQAVAVVGPGGYPNWLLSWLESEAYRTLPQGTKLYAAPPSAPVGVELSALRVQEWLHREHDILRPVQEIEQAMRTPCSCPVTERALAQQPAAVDEAMDTRCMDWLERHAVEVRTPMRYGSAALFHAEQVSDDDEPYRTNLRAQVAAALATQHQEPTT